MKTIRKLWPYLLADLVMVIVVAFFASRAMAQTLPVSYWTCDSTQLAGAILDNRGVFNMTIPSSTYAVTTGGKVGKYMTWTSGTNLGNLAPSNTTVTGSFTVEWIWRAGRDFNTTDIVRKNNGAWGFKIDLTQNNYCTPQFEFYVNTGSTSTLTIDLNGSDRKSVHYYLDGNWHHFAIQYNASNGNRKVYVDGLCPSGFSDVISGSPITTSDNKIIINNVTSYRKYYGDIDEIALYNSAISAAQIYQHWLNVQAGQHYSFTAFGGSIPSATVSSGFDANDYAPGSTIPTVGTHTTGVTTSAYNQIRGFQYPRFKKGHSLMRNYNWADLYYLGGYFQSGISTDSVAKAAAAINLDLAMRFNYMLIANVNTGSNISEYSDTTKLVGKLVKQANANPSIPVGATSFWSQLSPPVLGLPNQGEYVNQKDLPAQYYLRNDAGQFLDINGNVTVSSGSYVLSPACPLDSIMLDGKIQRYYLQALDAALTRPLNYISENDEVLPAWNDVLLAKDPTVVAQKNSLGVDWPTYMGMRKQYLTGSYRDTALKGLSPAPSFLVYKTEGRADASYLRYRFSNTLQRGQYYATPDFYPRWPYNWRNWNGAWNGLQHIIEGRNVELGAADRLYAPFISPGWSAKEEDNIRPGDWLGLLKLLAVSGAEYMHTGFFNDAPNYNPPNPPPPYPANYAWQLAAPSYAQACLTRASDLLFNGSLMAGDIPTSLDPPKSGSGYQFKTGNPMVPVMVRKSNTGRAYLIATALPRVSNDKLNAPMIDTVSAIIDGDTLKFQSRRQGSMYVYDRRDTANILFYQLDRWHEASHPSRWDQDEVLEAELMDSSTASVVIKTQVPKTASKGDYTGAVSYIVMPNTSVATYQIEPVKTTGYVVYIRARHATTGSGGVTIKCGGNTANFTNIAGNSFKWYAVTMGNLTKAIQDLRVECRQGRIHIDKIVLSENGALTTAQLGGK